MTLALDETVIVPVADPDDGERTARALEPYLTDTSTAVFVNVIEKGGGTIDKAPMDQRREYATKIYDRATDVLADAPGTVESETLYGTDVVTRIFDEATERGAIAVAFCPRKGGRIVQLLSGDVARRIVHDASVPVISLPKEQ